MTDKDRESIESMLTKAMATHSENVQTKLDAKFEVIELKLDAIEKQTTKTNGRVTSNEADISKLKEANILHSSNCPNDTRLRALEDAETGRRAVRSFTWKQWLVASGASAIVIMIIQAIIERI